MFDFNAIKKEINKENNSVSNKISLNLLDINPCKLFYSLYGVPVIGQELPEIKNYYYMDNVWDTAQYSYENREISNIPIKLIQYILNNPTNKYSIIYSGRVIKIQLILISTMNFLIIRYKTMNYIFSMKILLILLYIKMNISQYLNLNTPLLIILYY